MPRELAHWHILRSALKHEKIASRPALYTTISRESFSAYLGSVAHDIPYYYRAGLDPFEHVAEYMHGKDGEDTFEPMRLLAKEIAGKPNAEQLTLWPFLFGMLSHIAADTVFHPVVYYFTGNYNDPDENERRNAQARHRLFEVYLDNYIRPHVHFEWGFALRNLAAGNRERNNRLICDLLDSVLTPEKIWPEKYTESAASGRWESGLKQLCFYQRLFLSAPLGLLIRAAAAAVPAKLKGIDALFSLGRNPGEFFAGPLSYRNPVTGEGHEETVDDLFARAIDRTADYILCFEPVLTGEQNIAEVLGGKIGLSLNYGVPGAKAAEGRYFSETGAPLPGLRR